MDYESDVDAQIVGHTPKTSNESILSVVFVMRSWIIVHGSCHSNQKLKIIDYDMLNASSNNLFLDQVGHLVDGFVAKLICFHDNQFTVCAFKLVKPSFDGRMMIHTMKRQSERIVQMA